MPLHSNLYFIRLLICHLIHNLAGDFHPADESNPTAFLHWLDPLGSALTRVIMGTDTHHLVIRATGVGALFQKIPLPLQCPGEFEIFQVVLQEQHDGLVIEPCGVSNFLLAHSVR